jgi:hypothetical protein
MKQRFAHLKFLLAQMSVVVDGVKTRHAMTPSPLEG